MVPAAPAKAAEGTSRGANRDGDGGDDMAQSAEILDALANGSLLGASLTTNSPAIDPPSNHHQRPLQIETHCSYIFLTADRAFKLKKPVAFSYLDYRRLADRETFIKAELTLNRRTAPDLYLACHKIIRRNDGELALVPAEAAGKALEWLLEMRRFPDRALLADYAADHRLTPGMTRDLADVIYAFHRDAERRSDHGSANETEQVLLECIENLRRHTPPLDRLAVDTLAENMLEEFNRHRALIERRHTEGFVRHCHGDLHLGNICLIEGKPVLFDCIDFSERLSCIDVAYDLSFLLMDICHRSQGDHACLPLANLLLNRWIDRSADDDALVVLPVFQALRAAIRAHILATAHRDDEAIAYLATATAHLQLARPVLIAIGGLSGSGKSTLARGVAGDYLPCPGARIIRSDSLRKRLAGVAPETRLPADSYTPESSNQVYDQMQQEAHRALAAGYTVILDAAFLRPDERQSVAALAAGLGVAFHGIWLDVAPDILHARLAGRHNDASDADGDVLERQLTRDLGPITWRRFATGQDVEIDTVRLRGALAEQPR